MRFLMIAAIFEDIRDAVEVVGWACVFTVVIVILFAAVEILSEIDDSRSK